ncbi:hypothetical protein V5O48_007241 [Marasmius crinis-equi]|uniref:Cyclin N-terminal domain-containing protein n=1 Tax=Marasmius crinis-equi TaxID=585013 RepID=A0ABR3FH83_9AGAR
MPLLDLNRESEDGTRTEIGEVDGLQNVLAASTVAGEGDDSRLAPENLAKWIQQVLIERLATRCVVIDGDEKGSRAYRKRLLKWVMRVLRVFRPTNHVVFMGLLYFGRMAEASPSSRFCTAAKRLVWAKRMFMMAIHLAFVWLDDIPWYLETIAGWMQLSYEDVLHLQIDALRLLRYDLSVSSEAWKEALLFFRGYARTNGCQLDYAFRGQEIDWLRLGDSGVLVDDERTSIT